MTKTIIIIILFIYLSNTCLFIIHHTLLNNNIDPVCVLTCDGRLIQGKLVGYDQLQNLILQEAQERVYQLPPPTTSNDDGDNNNNNDDDDILEIVPLGLYIIRGDNVALVSEVNDEVWELQLKNEFKEFTKDAQGIKPIVQAIK